MKSKIIRETYKICKKFDNVISGTFVGSFVDNFDIKKNSDIDFVVIVKKITKNFFVNFNSEFSKDKFGFDIYINNSFGPLKYKFDNKVVFHIMIYDVNSHINHIYDSPFTCLDWERSKIFFKNRLSDIAAVNSITLNDFNNVRRGIEDYLYDLNNKLISYREYRFENKKVKLIKRYLELDELSQVQYSYHIVKFLCTNYLKFETKKNVKFSNNFLEKFFNKILSNNNKISFSKIYDLKVNNKSLSYDLVYKTTFKFVKKFEKYVYYSYANNKKLIFIRHLKTYKNNGYFLGQTTNPSIIKNQVFKIRSKPNRIFFSSPLKRCLDTFDKLKIKDKLNIDKNLMEINYGEADGLPINEFLIKNKKIVSQWNKKKDPRFPNGENYKDLLLRINKFINKITKKYSKELAIYSITHNVFIRGLIGSVYNLPQHKWYKLKIPHGIELEFIYYKNKVYSNISRNLAKEIFSEIDKDSTIYFTR